jgi:branched-chain amino acid transport system permease protein
MTDAIRSETTSPKPGAARVKRSTPASIVFSFVALATVIVLITLPTWGSVSVMRKMVGLLTFVALAQMWNLLAGFAGVVSVGQQAFVGLGAYGMVVFVNSFHQNIYFSVLLSALVVALVSIPMGLVAFRLRGSYFAIGTWVLAEVASLVMVNNSAVGGGSGASIKVTNYDLATRQKAVYWLALLIGVGAILASYLLLRSRIGLQMQAIRDNEDGARSLGANVYRTRFTVWVLAAFITSMAAANYYLSAIRVQPTDSFSVGDWTAPIIFMVVIGGIGTIEGPIIGAALFYFFRDRFIDGVKVGPITFGVNWYSITLGVLAVIVALRVQGGLWGPLKRRGLDLFPVSRRLLD